MERENLDDLIVKENEKLQKLREKHQSIGAKISDCEAQIEKLTLLKNQETLRELSKSFGEMGIVFDDVIQAIKEGNLRTLLDNASQAKEA